MATKKTSSGKSSRTTRKVVLTKGWFLRACSFLALVIAATVLVVGGILNVVGAGGSIISVFDLIGKICLVIGIGVPAYDFVRGKTVGWQVAYWVALILYILSCVLGMI